MYKRGEDPGHKFPFSEHLYSTTYQLYFNKTETKEETPALEVGVRILR